MLFRSGSVLVVTYAVFLSGGGGGRQNYSSCYAQPEAVQEPEPEKEVFQTLSSPPEIVAFDGDPLSATMTSFDGDDGGAFGITDFPDRPESEIFQTTVVDGDSDLFVTTSVDEGAFGTTDFVQEGGACTEEARICASLGGVAQSREGPECKFPYCPGLDPEPTGADVCDDAKDTPGSSLYVTYDGTPAQCDSPSCRRLHAAETTRCPSSTPAWEMIYTLGSTRSVDVLSCPNDDILSITLLGTDTADFTQSERDFFANFAAKIEATTAPPVALDDKNSLEAQVIHASRILAAWPPGYPVAYVLDAAGESANQPDYTVVDGNDPAVPPGGRRRRASEVSRGRQLQTTPLYTSMCPNLGSYLEDLEGNSIFAKLDFSPACAAPNFMLQYNEDDTSPSWDCDSVPMPVLSGAQWISGDCFGRCGAGVSGCDTGSFAQYTADCATYDFCTRVLPGNDCDDEFDRMIDDWMWSGNCDETTGEEVVPPGEECEGEDQDQDEALTASSPTAPPIGGPGGFMPPMPQYRCRAKGFDPNVPVTVSECETLTDCSEGDQQVNNACGNDEACVEAPACMAQQGNDEIINMDLVCVCHLEGLGQAVSYKETCSLEPDAAATRVAENECDFIVDEASSCLCVPGSVAKCAPAGCPDKILAPPPPPGGGGPGGPGGFAPPQPQYRCRPAAEKDIEVAEDDCDSLARCYSEIDDQCADGGVCVDAQACMAELPSAFTPPPVGQRCLEMFGEDRDEIDINCRDEKCPDGYECAAWFNNAAYFCCSEKEEEDEGTTTTTLPPLNPQPPAQDAARALADENLNLWDSVDFDADYDYVLERRCESCEPGPFYLEVRNYEIVETPNPNDERARRLKPGPSDLPTVMGLFEFITEVLDNSPQGDTIKASYDPARGYPTRVDATFAADGSTLGYSILKLRSAKEGAPPEPVEMCGQGSSQETTCEWSEFCCNDSCGICAPLGGSCIELFCMDEPMFPEEETIDVAAEQTRFDDAAAKWTASGLVDYSFTYQRSCYCYPREYVAPYDVEVLKDNVTSVDFASGYVPDAPYYYTADELDNITPVDPVPVGKFLTVPEMFADVQAAIDRKVAVLTVTYDEIYGVPLNVWIDDTLMIADEERGFAVTNFGPVV